jgi:nicotinamidase-related amidase
MRTDRVSDWLREIGKYNRHPMKLRRKRACLLIVDMQNEFLQEDGAVFFHYAAEIVPNVKRILRACRRTSVHEDPAVDGGMTAEWWPEIKRGESLIKGTRGVEIYRELKPLKTEKIIWKHRYSAFYNTDLETTLRGLGITDIIITGVLTNVCCESTARDAFFRDYRIFFLADATASSEPEFHTASLKNLAYAFAYVTTTDEVVRQIEH